MQDFSVCAVRVLIAYVFDKIDLFQHIAALILLVQPSVNDRERQGAIVPYEQHGGHIEQQISLPCDVCELGARVMVFRKIEAKNR